MNLEWFIPDPVLNEFRILEKVPEPTGSGSDPYYFKHVYVKKMPYRIINQKEDSTYYHLKNLTYLKKHSTVFSVQFRQFLIIFSVFFFFILDPDPKQITLDPDLGKKVSDPDSQHRP